MSETAYQTVHRIRTPDGRTIRAFDGGAPNGAPFIFHHGTPLCGRLQAQVVDDAAAQLRVITYDRPGYGESSRLPGLRVGSSAVDTQAVADHFQLGRGHRRSVRRRPARAGRAALLPDRVVAAAVVAGDAPFDAEGLDWFDGMGDLNTEERDVMQQGEEAYHAYLRAQAAELAGSTPDELREAIASLLSPVDSAALTGDVIEHMHATMTEALAAGIEGGRTSRRPSTSRGGSTWPRSTCPCGSGTASTTGSSRWPTGGGSPSTSPARSSTCGRTMATSA